MADRGWNPIDLARAASVDSTTVADFIEGHRWPKIRTQGRIEKALGWEPGTIRGMEAGEHGPPPLGSRAGMLRAVETMPGLERSEREELMEAVRHASAWQVRTLSDVYKAIAGIDGRG